MRGRDSRRGDRRQGREEVGVGRGGVRGEEEQGKGRGALLAFGPFRRLWPRSLLIK
jgi:hypothetical protein